jgi:Spy/CpxP family protein refolding chaperone
MKTSPTTRKNLVKLALLALLLFVPPAARAQEGPPPPGAPQGPPPGRPGDGGLLMKLNLTPEQRQRLRQIRRQSEPEARSLGRRLREAHRALDEAVYSDDVDESIVEQRTRELSEAQAALVRLRAQTELRVRRILTPEQLQTFRALRQEALRQRLLQRRRDPEARRANRRDRRLRRGLPPPEGPERP